MKVLFFGDMDASGFGTVTMDLGRRMLDLGDDVRFWSQNAVRNLSEPWASRTLNVLSIQQANRDDPDEELFERHKIDVVSDVVSGIVSTHPLTRAPIFGRVDGSAWDDWKPDACIVLGDYQATRMFVTGPATLQNLWWAEKRLAAFGETRSLHYVPIEGEDLPPSWDALWSAIEPVAMSNFGAAQIAKVTGRMPTMIYHGVDTEVFHPVSVKAPLVISSVGADEKLTSKDDCKRAFVQFLGQRNGVSRIPKKWMLRTDRHMPRKQYNVMLRAIAPVLRRCPDWALVIHCQAWDQGGFLRDTLSKPEFDGVRDRILLTDYRGMPRDMLVALYNAADLYVSTSAEGFGLTIAEALSCGVPAVGVDYSAVPEVIGPAGTVVAKGHLIDNEYDHFWFAPDPDAFGRAVEFLCTHQSRREELGRKGPAHIAARFSWDQAARQFHDLLHSDVVVQSAA